MRLFRPRQPKPPRGVVMTMASGDKWEILPGTAEPAQEPWDLQVQARPLVRWDPHEPYGKLAYRMVDVESVSW